MIFWVVNMLSDKMKQGKFASLIRDIFRLQFKDD